MHIYCNMICPANALCIFHCDNYNQCIDHSCNTNNIYFVLCKPDKVTLERSCARKRSLMHKVLLLSLG